MKTTKIILDQYLYKYQKFLVFYLLFSAILGWFAIPKTPDEISFYVLSILFPSLILFLFSLLICHRGLCIIDGTLYRGLVISKTFIFKTRVDLKPYTEFDITKREKSEFPWFMEYSGFGLFANYYSWTIYLLDHENGLKKRLISSSLPEHANEVARFLEHGTNLRLRNNELT